MCRSGWQRRHSPHMPEGLPKLKMAALRDCCGLRMRRRSVESTRRRRVSSVSKVKFINSGPGEVESCPAAERLRRQKGRREEPGKFKLARMLRLL
ncbi:hypothetical protein FKM82_027039 [Ascaphus truei]